MLEGRRSFGIGLGRRLVILTLMVGCSPAESSDDPSQQAVTDGEGPETYSDAPPSEEARHVSELAPVPIPSPLVVPAGASMTFRLSESLSTESNRAGDGFSGTLVSDLASAEGEVLVPSGSRASGVVVVSQESQSADESAVLELKLESVEVGGEMHPVAASIVATEVRSETRDSGRETAAKIGVGTAAGALVGGLIGRDRQGALIGAGAGAVAGTAVAITTNDGHARIDAGSAVTAVLEEPLKLR